jgi:hypothetical protein
VYVPPLSTNLEELKIRIKDAVNAVTQDMISNVWEELLLDFIYPVTRPLFSSRMMMGKYKPECFRVIFAVTSQRGCRSSDRHRFVGLRHGHFYEPFAVRLK